MTNPTVRMSPVLAPRCQNCDRENAQVRCETVGSRMDVCLKCIKANSGRFGWPVYEDAKATYDEWTKAQV